MQKKIRKWLLDIQRSIHAIHQYLGNNPRFEDYQCDQMMKRAIEREFEIIGEAVNRSINQDPNIAISQARKIVDLRNHIIHTYDNVSDEIIWGIINQSLPVLEIEVNTLLEKGMDD